jgi:hypothetical protein
VCCRSLVGEGEGMKDAVSDSFDVLLLRRKDRLCRLLFLCFAEAIVGKTGGGGRRDL